MSDPCPRPLSDELHQAIREEVRRVVTETGSFVVLCEPDTHAGSLRYGLAQVEEGASA